LAEKRKEIGLSQEKLGFEAEMDRSFISLLERGMRSPTLDTLIRLGKVLDVSLTQLSIAIELELKTETYGKSEDL
jgi:transcriptional regulator with XRE-family HTH domain